MSTLDQPAAINASTASQSLRSLVFSNPSNVDQHRGVSFMFPSRADGNDERTEFRSLSTDHVSLQRRHGGSGSTVTYMVLSRDGAGGNSIVRASNND